jgi:hypothetical protein
MAVRFSNDKSIKPDGRSLSEALGGARRPSIVWVILVWYVYKAIGYILGVRLLRTTALVSHGQIGAVMLPQFAAYWLGAILSVLAVGGSIALVLRHRIAPWLFTLALLAGIGLSLVSLSRWSGSGAQNVAVVSNAILNLVVNALVCLYVWNLRRMGYYRP